MWKQDPVGDRPTPETVPAAPPPRTEERRLVAWVGQSVQFRGDLISSEDMTIDGHVEGTIEVREHVLVIGPHAQIEADIVARRVTVHGRVKGLITAEEHVDLRDAALVEGDILCARISIAEGAEVHGRIETGAKTSAAGRAAVSVATS